jgi:hypothetical protein
MIQGIAIAVLAFLVAGTAGILRRLIIKDQQVEKKVREVLADHYDSIIANRKYIILLAEVILQADDNQLSEGSRDKLDQIFAG